MPLSFAKLRHRSTLVGLAILGLLGSGLAGCTGGTGSESVNSDSIGVSSSAGSEQPGNAPEASIKGTIGFSALSLTNPFFKIIGDSITAEAKKHGYATVVTDADSDVSEQAKHLDNFIALGVTAIVLNPADRTAIGPAIKRANEAGIPVFTCDLECVAADVQIAGHIGTDNFQGGKLAGAAMIEALGEAGGEVLVLHFKQANSCVLRVQGFTEVINAYNAGRESGKIDVVAELEGGGSQTVGLKATADSLQAHPGLRGIFAINDPSALGAWKALDQAGKTDQVTIVGFDGQLEGKQAIREGKIFADPIQFPVQMGVVSVQNIIRYLDGEPFNATELIPTELYKKADADRDPELAALDAAK